jgi:hypothetical protein
MGSTEAVRGHIFQLNELGLGTLYDIIYSKRVGVSYMVVF